MARRKKPLLNRLGSLLLFLLITLIVFNFQTIVKQTAIKMGWADLNWISIKEVQLETDDVLDHRADIMNFNENLLVHFKNEISLYDSDGNSLGKKAIQSVNSQIVGLDDYVVIVDKQQGNMSVIDYDGNDIASSVSIGPVQDVIAASNNTFVMLTENNYFEVYDYSLALIFSKKLPDGELLGLDISNEKDYLLLTLLISMEDKYNSRLLTYDINQICLIGGNDNVNTIVYGSKMIRNEIIIVDLKGQHAYTKGNPEDVIWNNERIGKLQHFSIDHSGNIFEINEIVEVQDIMGLSEYHLVCRNKDGKEVFDIKLDDEYSAIRLLEGKILLVSDTKLLIYNYAGTLITELNSNKKIYGATWLNSNRMVIEYNDFLEIMELRY